MARVDRTLDRAARQGYQAIEEQHRRRVTDVWRRSDSELTGAPDLQRSVRFNLFQLLQATARSEGLGVPAKGVTGRGRQRLRFRVQARGQLVEVDLTQEATTYRLLEGRGILLRHFGEALWLTPEKAVHRPTPAAASVQDLAHAACPGSLSAPA